MERRSFLTLLPLMPMAGKLMVVMPKKYLGVEALAAATKQMAPWLVDLLFREDPMLAYLRTHVLADTPDGSQLVEEWVYEPEDAHELGKDGPG